jgi:hypothetical protein
MGKAFCELSRVGGSMARKIELEIEIDPKGNVRFHVHGRKGTSCCEFMSLMTKSLGKVIHEEKTIEYYETENTAESTKIDASGK